MQPTIIIPPAPLGGPPPSEVLLANAPLACVLAQVKFPTILVIEDRSRVAPFQADLRAEYPVFRQEAGQNLRIDMGPSGPNVSTDAVTLWRFMDLEGHWTVTLGPEAITLETRAYDQRQDFLGRLSSVLQAVERHFAPGIAERLGIRYVSRVTGEGYDRIEEIISSGLLGVAIPPLRDHVTHAISEAAMTAEEGGVMMRWGMLPPNGTIDPLVLEPVNMPSWVLDIDVSTTGYSAFEAQSIMEKFGALAQRAYSVFRYMVTDSFLTLYGGKP